MQRFLFVVLVVALNACGLALNSTGDFIDEFQVQTYATDNDTNAALSPNVGEGNFLIRWELKTQEDFDISLFVEKERHQRTKNHSLFSIQCSEDDESDLCTNSISVNCSISVELVISCESDDIADFNISEVIQQLPDTVYFLLETCSSLDNTCDHEEKGVTFYRNVADLIVDDVLPQEQETQTETTETQ